MSSTIRNMVELDVFSKFISKVYNKIKKNVKFLYIRIFYRGHNIIMQDLHFLSEMNLRKVSKLIPLLQDSKSQLRQDLFVISELNFKRNGYYVEFGACDGVKFSNSWILENIFSWTGILAEPAEVWQNSIRLNRPKSIIDTRCVWKNSKSKVVFNEVDSPVLSTIDLFSNLDSHGPSRKNGRLYEVRTVSLQDLLDQYNAPKYIDYLSIDTEGSEFEILNAFNFKKYKFRIITIEHNNTTQRPLIYKLLTDNGYRRKFTDVIRGEDWYIA